MKMFKPLLTNAKGQQGGERSWWGTYTDTFGPRVTLWPSWSLRQRKDRCDFCHNDCALRDVTRWGKPDLRPGIKQVCCQSGHARIYSCIWHVLIWIVGNTVIIIINWWVNWKCIILFFTAPACQGNLLRPSPQGVQLCPNTERTRKRKKWKSDSDSAEPMTRMSLTCSPGGPSGPRWPLGPLKTTKKKQNYLWVNTNCNIILFPRGQSM